MKFKLWPAVALTLLAATFSFSHSHSDHQGVSIDHPWARSSAPGAPSAGFMMVSNKGESVDVLLSVAGDFAKKLEVHQTKQVDGVMKMIHQQDGVEIPAGGQVMFKPGGYHLMFMGLDKNFEVGETYKVTLTFKHAGEIEVMLPVKDMADSPMKH